MDEAKPMEFCLLSEGAWYGSDEVPPTHPDVLYHTILKSEYDALAKENKRLREALEKIQKALVPWTSSRDAWEQSEEFYDRLALMVDGALEREGEG